jgi:PilZ domain-containing protein
MSGTTSKWDSAVMPTADLREFPRLHVWGEATLRRSDSPGAPRFPVTLIDISHGGICFAIDQELAIDDQVILDMEPPDGSAHLLTMPAQVRWIVTDVDANEHRVGCAWLQSLSMDDLLKFC